MKQPHRRRDDERRIPVLSREPSTFTSRVEINAAVMLQHHGIAIGVQETAVDVRVLLSDRQEWNRDHHAPQTVPGSMVHGKTPGGDRFSHTGRRRQPEEAGWFGSRPHTALIHRFPDAIDWAAGSTLSEQIRPTPFEPLPQRGEVCRWENAVRLIREVRGRVQMIGIAQGAEHQTQRHLRDQRIVLPRGGELRWPGIHHFRE